jgi:hypothetical protein
MGLSASLQIEAGGREKQKNRKILKKQKIFENCFQTLLKQA